MEIIKVNAISVLHFMSVDDLATSLPRLKNSKEEFLVDLLELKKKMGLGSGRETILICQCRIPFQRVSQAGAAVSPKFEDRARIWI